MIVKSIVTTKGLGNNIIGIIFSTNVVMIRHD